MINRFYGHISEKNGNKYLTIDKVDKNNDMLKNMIRFLLVSNIL